jgi:hypothetical protein
MKYVSLEKSRAGWQADPAAAVLRGAALDDALEVAGLPKTGSADEKRAALAEYQAADESPAAPDTSADSAARITHTDGGPTASKPEEG